MKVLRCPGREEPSLIIGKEGEGQNTKENGRKKGKHHQGMRSTAIGSRETLLENTKRFKAGGCQRRGEETREHRWAASLKVG